MDYSKFTDKTRSTVSRAFSIAKESRYPEITPLVMLSAMIDERGGYGFLYLAADEC